MYWPKPSPTRDSLPHRFETGDDVEELLGDSGLSEPVSFSVEFGQSLLHIALGVVHRHQPARRYRCHGLREGAGQPSEDRLANQRCEQLGTPDGVGGQAPAWPRLTDQLTETSGVERQQRAISGFETGMTPAEAGKDQVNSWVGIGAPPAIDTYEQFCCPRADSVDAVGQLEHHVGRNPGEFQLGAEAEPHCHHLENRGRTRGDDLGRVAGHLAVDRSAQPLVRPCLLYTSDAADE